MRGLRQKIYVYVLRMLLWKLKGKVMSNPTVHPYVHFAALAAIPIGAALAALLGHPIDTPTAAALVGSALGIGAQAAGSLIRAGAPIAGDVAGVIAAVKSAPAPHPVLDQATIERVAAAIAAMSVQGSVKP